MVESSLSQQSAMPVGNLTDDVERAARWLREGRLVAFPTETVYGLGADASNPAAVEQIFHLKGRPADHPLIVHLAEAAQLDTWARDIPPVAYRLAERFWPGPLALILQKSAAAPPQVTGGQDTIGLRVPAHPVARELLKAFGGGVAAPSANRFGRISPTRAEHVVEEFGAELDLVLDGGSCHVGVESTILSLAASSPVLLRPGGIGRAELAEVLGEEPLCLTRNTNDVRAPGVLPSHYAPGTPLELVDREGLPQRLQQLSQYNQRLGLLVLGPTEALCRVGLPHKALEMPSDAKAYARELYAAMRLLDGGGFDRILVETPPRSEAWNAINNRLQRAAHHTMTGVTTDE